MNNEKVRTYSAKAISAQTTVYCINIKVFEHKDKMFKFLKDVDELSLSTGKSININLIKKVLNK